MPGLWDPGIGGGGFLNTLNNLFSNPNMQNMMAGVGRGIGGQGSVGDVLGGAAQNLVRAQQFQKGASTRDDERKKFNLLIEKVLGGLTSDNVLDQGNLIDSVLQDAKGTTVKYGSRLAEQGDQTLAREKPKENYFNFGDFMGGS